MGLGQIQQSLAGATHNSDISVATNVEFRVLYVLLNELVLFGTSDLFITPSCERGCAMVILLAKWKPKLIWKRSRATVCLSRLAELN